jgi:transmembrane sensor
MKRSDHPSPSADEAAIASAAAWIALRETGFTAEQAARFAKWRDEDSRNSAALRRAEATQQLLTRLPETPAAAALFAEVDGLCAQRSLLVRFPLLFKSAAIFGVAACICFVVLNLKPAPASANATYRTTAATHHSINLPDGSTVVLNPSTEVKVDYVPSERRLSLQSGEAHFYVAKDASRPFFVTAGSVTVRAVGTAFNVRRQSAGIDVLVTEGKVRVSRLTSTANASAELEPIYLVAGERAVIDDPTNRAAANVAVASVTPAHNVQRAPRLMFNNTPLADVVARFNLHNRVQMEIADADLAQRSVGGNFDADNAESFINLLSTAGDIRVERVSATRVLLYKAQ